MDKKHRVNYPKKKNPVKEKDLVEVKEPERKSMYEVLQENLKIAGRATFLHRIIYIGEHTFFTFNDAKEIFQNIIKKCNKTYCIDKLTGFFLFYNSYFLHMVEGDEDNLNKHLSFLLDKTAPHAVFLGNIKLLIHVSHINQRFFDDWVTFTGTPPKLLEELDIQADMAQSGRLVYNCIKKIYSLMSMFAQEEEEGRESTIDDSQRSSRGRSGSLAMSSWNKSAGSLLKPSQIGISQGTGTSKSTTSQLLASSQMLASNIQSSRMLSFFTKSSERESGEQMNTSVKTESKYRIYLPEFELLDFVLKTSFSMKLQDYYSIYGVVPMRDIYKDRVWPVPHDFIPYDVFEKPYDCITEIPKERDSRKPGTVSSSFQNMKSGSRSTTPPVI